LRGKVQEQEHRLYHPALEFLLNKGAFSSFVQPDFYPRVHNLQALALPEEAYIQNIHINSLRQ